LELLTSEKNKAVFLLLNNHAAMPGSIGSSIKDLPLLLAATLNGGRGKNKAILKLFFNHNSLSAPRLSGQVTLKPQLFKSDRKKQLAARMFIIFLTPFLEFIRE
jgi:hypothetical protein